MLTNALHDTLGLTPTLLEAPFFAILALSLSAGTGEARGTPPIPVAYSGGSDAGGASSISESRFVSATAPEHGTQRITY